MRSSLPAWLPPKPSYLSGLEPGSPPWALDFIECLWPQLTQSSLFAWPPQEPSHLIGPEPGSSSWFTFGQHSCGPASPPDYHWEPSYLSGLSSVGPLWLLFSSPLSFHWWWILLILVVYCFIFCNIVTLMLLLSEYSCYCFSDPGYIFQVFQSHKIVKSVATSVLQVFNKHHTTQDLCLLPS